MSLETNTELPKDLKLTKEFIEAFKVVNETSKNVFITGNAGTGKSTLLEYFREKTKKNTAIVAHQGITCIKNTFRGRSRGHTWICGSIRCS